MSPSNRCGDCDLCCRALAIEALDKPPGALCRHYGGGCAIYEDRPDACRGFRCLWLKCEDLAPEARMGPQWRPDRAGFMMYPEQGGRRLTVVVDEALPDAWTLQPYYDHLKRLSHRAAEGFELVVYVADRRIAVRPDGDVELTPPL